MKIRARNVRYRHFDMLRYSTWFKEWLSKQAARLFITPQQVFNQLLAGKTASQVEGTAAPVAPANTVLPAITGTAQVGQTLTVSNGTWTGTATITYARQWKKAGVNISGATAATYVPVTGDIGATITCTVTATNTAGSASATSAATAAVIAA